MHDFENYLLSHFAMEDDERYDAHHLNDKGAIKFTKMLNEEIRLKNR